MTYETLLVDTPAERVRQITINRPEVRNAISNTVRSELFAALADHDRDPGVGITILCGAGPCFSSGYDLKSDLSADRPHETASGDGAWMRQVTHGWFSMWDLAKPVIAKVHGYALAGATEMMAGCDLAYAADNAKIGFPVTRLLGPPDMQFHPWLVGMRNAMELVLTGDSVDGAEAARMGMINRAYPEADLDAEVLRIATKIAKTASDLTQLNKRSVHRAMEHMGMRTAIRAASDLSALSSHLDSVQAFRANPAAAMKTVTDKPPPAAD